MLSLRVRPEAEQDLAESYQFYESKVPGLGERFLSAIHESMVQLRRDPAVYPISYRGVRQAIVRKYPFSICYILHESEVEVVAVFHASRNPGEWQSRL